MKHELVVHITL